jgi:hypothetical protein
MKSITMYIFKNRFKPLICLLFLLCCFTSQAQTYIANTTHSNFYSCDFYRTEQKQSKNQISMPGSYSTLPSVDFIAVGEGTNLSPLGDDETKDIPISGFPFKFFCSNVTSLRVGTDGALLVNSPTSNVPSANPVFVNLINPNVPTIAPAIAPWWGSFNKGTGQVRYIRKSNPERLIIQWSDISPAYSGISSATDLKATFRAILYSENNVDSLKSVVAFYYQDVDFETDAAASSVTVKNYAKSYQNASKGGIGLKGLCLSGAVGDVVNPIVKDETDGTSLYSLAFDQLIRAIIFKPKFCELPNPIDTAVCQSDMPFQLPKNNSKATNGVWTYKTSPPIEPGLIDANNIISNFKPSQPGIYKLTWNPGCAEYGFDATIRVDAKVDILTSIPARSGCGQKTFTLQGSTPSVLTVANNPVWQYVSGSLNPLPTFPTTANPITLTDVFGEVKLKYVNGVCSADVLVKNIPPPPVTDTIVRSICNVSGEITLSIDPATNIEWSFGPNKPSGVNFSPAPAPPSSSPNTISTTIVGLNSTSIPTIVNVKYQIGTACFAKSFKVSAASPPPATIEDGKGNKNQTFTQCDNGKFKLTGDTPTDANFVGEWQYVTALPFGVAPSVLSGNPVNISGVPMGGEIKVRWIVSLTSSSSTSCNDTVTVTLKNLPPVVATAGPNKFNCNDSSFIMTANNPAPNIGTWSVVSPSGFSLSNILNINAYNTKVNNVPINTPVTLRWTVTNACSSSSSDVVLTNSESRASAGQNQSKCSFGNTSFTLAANTPSAGSGTWTIVSSTPAGFPIANVSPVNSPSAMVSNVPVGTSVTLRWTVTNNGCVSSSTVTVTNNQDVTASIRPVPPTCDTSSFSLTANTPVSPATGVWSVVGIAPVGLSILPITSPTPTVTGVPSNKPVTLRWTVTNGNGTCSSSATIILNNVAPATVVLKNFNCPTTYPINLDNLIDSLIGDGIWSALGTITGAFSGGNHPLVNGTTLNGTTNYTGYTPSATELECGEINLQISVTNICTTIPVVKTIQIKLGTSILVPAQLNLSLDYGTNNCEKILTGNILCQNNYKHYTLKICRVGIVPTNGKCECNAFSYIPNNKIDASLIGQTIGVELSDACGNKATTCVKIEDKRPPIIVCPKDVSVYCNTQVSLGSDNPLPSVTGDLGLDNITPTANGAMDGSIKDCSPTTASYIDECVYTENCKTPFTDATKPSANTIFACLKGTNVTLALAQELRDRMITTGGDVIKFIIRRWVAQDFIPSQTPPNNISDPCYQVIAIRRLPFTIVAPADVKYSCNGAITDCTPTIPAAPASLASSVTGYPFVDINGNGIFDIREDIVLNTEGAIACGIRMSEKNDTFPTCKGSRKIVRTFTIFSDCNNATKVVTQTIELLDLTPPVVRAEYLSYERVAKKYCYVDPYLGKVDKISYDVVAKPQVLDNFLGKQIVTCDYNTEGPKKTLLAIGDANDCNKFFVRFRFVACDHFCTKDLVTITSNSSTITGRRLTAQDFIDANGVPNYVWEFSGFINAEGSLFDADYAYGEGECQKQGANCRDISFTAKDVCGNAFAKQTFRVYMIDNQKPLVNCITSHTASLGTNGTDRIAAATFNNGSKDNCGIAGFKVRRMDQKYFDPTTIDGFDCSQPALQDTCFRDYVEFTCKDVDSTIMVEMLAYDFNCNTNSCMVEVKVQNKNRPLCAAPAPETTTCENIATKIANPKAYFVGTANAFYNCGYTIDELAATGNLNNCGIGTVTRTWVVKNCANNAELSRCQQTINVTGKSDFSVDFPQDVQLECSGVIESFDQLRARMLNPANWGKDGSIKNDGCGVLVIGIKDDTLYGTIGTECMIIKRRICVSDWCVGTIEMPLRAAESGLELNQTNRIFRDWDNATDPRYRDGYICYTQIIKIVDVTAPDLVTQPDRTICFEKGFCRGALQDTLVAFDKCGAVASSSFLKYSWTILAPASGKVGDVLVELPNGRGTGPIVTYPNLPAGVYTIRWTASDQCGNLQLVGDEFVLTLKDCEAPSIVGNLKVAVLGGIPLGSNGMATICLSDLLTSVNDNCTSVSILRQNARLVRESSSFIYPTDSKDTCVMILCSDFKNDSAGLVLWTRDEAGISNYARIAIKVQDNLGVCRTSPGIAAASGTILNDKNVAIQNAQISASMRGNAASLNAVMTSNTGGFEINNLILGQGYDFRVAKEDEVYAGVTTLDIAIISRHLLEIEKLKTPCSIIAADVDGNRVVDGADMLHLRNFILRKTSSLPAGAWKFVDKKYTFINPNEPLVEDFPQIVTVANIAQNLSLGFTAVKVGDVNNTYRPQTIVAPTPRSSNTLTFETEDKTLEAGKTYSIKLKSSDFKASDFQFTLGFAEGVATMKSVEAGNLPNMGNSNFAVFKNAITTSWNGVSKEVDVEAMTLTFIANQNVKLSDVLTINSSITPSEAQNTEGPPLKIQLTFGNNVAKEAGEFALYQNRPNPMLNSTAIGFNLPKEGEATLTIYNIEGKAMKVVNSAFKAGYNEVMVEKETFQTSGVYYYRLETSEHSATKKMVVSF